jgi:hypothetical protein
MRKFYKLLAVCIILVFASTVYGAVYVPTRINGLKGDIVLSPNGSGPLSGLFQVLHSYWSHSGMLVNDGYNIRHNTMDFPAYNKTWIGCPTSLKSDPLSNGVPGMLTETINNAYNVTHNFTAGGGVVLKPTAALEASYRPLLNAVANKMAYMDAYYRPYGYANFFQMDDSNVRVKGRGGHCSGTNWFANYFSGKTMALPYHSSQTVYDAAVQLYNGVRNAALDELGWCGKLFCGSGCADKMANQVVNTFGFDRATDTSSYWRSRLNGPTGYVTTVAPAPDNLLMASYRNPAGYYPGVQTASSSYYGAVEGLMFIDGYYK